MQEGKGEAVDPLQAFAFPTHRDSLLIEGEQTALGSFLVMNLMDTTTVSLKDVHFGCQANKLHLHCKMV